MKKKDNKEDYIVVKDHQTARDLLTKYKGKALQEKWIIVAPDGIERLSSDGLINLPQIKEALRQERGKILKEVEDNLYINAELTELSTSIREWQILKIRLS